MVELDRSANRLKTFAPIVSEEAWEFFLNTDERIHSAVAGGRAISSEKISRRREESDLRLREHSCEALQESSLMG